MSRLVRRRDFLIATVAAPAMSVIGANDTVRVGVMGVLSYKLGCRVRWDARAQQAVPDVKK